jgi:hypothetical protein
VFEEVKRRPLYVVRDAYNFDEAASTPSAATIRSATPDEEP